MPDDGSSTTYAESYPANYMMAGTAPSVTPVNRTGPVGQGVIYSRALEPRVCECHGADNFVPQGGRSAPFHGVILIVTSKNGCDNRFVTTETT